MIKILDCEGEMVVTLTDVVDRNDLESRLANEDQALIDVCNDTPYFGDVVGDSDYGTSEAEVEGIEQRICTYAEWIKDSLDWAREAIAQ